MPQGSASVLPGAIIARPCGRLMCAFRVLDPNAWSVEVGDGRLVTRLEVSEEEAPLERMAFYAESEDGEGRPVLLGRSDTFLMTSMFVSRILGSQGVFDVFLLAWRGAYQVGKTPVKSVHMLASLEGTRWDRKILDVINELMEKFPDQEVEDLLQEAHEPVEAPEEERLAAL